MDGDFVIPIGILVFFTSVYLAVMAIIKVATVAMAIIIEFWWVVPAFVLIAGSTYVLARTVYFAVLEALEEAAIHQSDEQVRTELVDEYDRTLSAMRRAAEGR